MNRLLHIALLALLATAALTSCNDNSCRENGSSLPLAVFYVNGSQQSVNGLTIMGIGAPGDSLLAEATAQSELYLPLRATTTTTSYKISHQVTTERLVSDTVTIDYQPVEYFHSVECGAMFNFDIKNVRYTKHGIDSVVVVTPLVTNSTLPALRFFLKQFDQ